MTETSPAPAEILVVEDTPASLELLTDLLRGAGYAVRPAQEGRMALRSALARPPDLILLDIRMPGMDGYEVCRRLKTDPRTRDVPVIFLSALRDTGNKVQAFEFGAVDYISKPYQPDEVLARVRTHLDLHRLRSRLEDLVAERTAQFQEADASLRASQARLQELAGFLETAREEERARIARELHDELGQALTALRIDLAWLRKKCAPLGPAVEERATAAHSLVERSIDSLRRISQGLRPGMLDVLGLAAAIEHHVAQFQERTGIRCDLSMNREEFQLGDQLATAIFRIVQEALTNVMRHAAADHVSVMIEDAPDHIRVRVEDDGQGFVLPSQKKTFGLLGIQERTKMLGGRLDIDSQPGAGTRIEAWFPKAQGETE